MTGIAVSLDTLEFRKRNVEPTKGNIVTTSQAGASLVGQLWSDEPAEVDLLAAKAIAETVADAILDDALDPLSLGLSGPWGSGKTTVLVLISAELDERSTAESKVLVVRTDPWRYDPSVGAKESLIADILDELAAELQSRPETAKSKAAALVKRLAKRVDWAKALRLAATTAVALQIPAVDQITDLTNLGSAPDLVLDVYRASTRDRKATLSLWLPAEAVSTPHLWQHVGPPVVYEVAHPWISRIGLQPGHVLDFAAGAATPDPSALRHFEYAVIGDCTTVEGLEAPFDEENTTNTFVVQDLAGSDVFTFWRSNANTPLHEDPTDTQGFRP